MPAKDLAQSTHDMVLEIYQRFPRVVADLERLERRISVLEEFVHAERPSRELTCSMLEENELVELETMIAARRAVLQSG